MKSCVSKKRKLSRVPSDVFRQCPHCHHQNLLRMDGEALCTRCDWTSISATLDAIGLRAFQLGATFYVEPDMDETEDVAPDPIAEMLAHRERQLIA